MEVSDREKRSLPPRACSDCYSLNPHLKTVPLNSDLAPSHFVYGRALHRARQTVINRVQSSQIKIACRSTYIHGAILSVDEWQHSVAFLVLYVCRSHPLSIHPSSPLYLFPTHVEREKRPISDYHSCEHAIEDYDVLAGTASYSPLRVPLLDRD
jgi:hypothetical protein